MHTTNKMIAFAAVVKVVIQTHPGTIAALYYFLLGLLVFLFAGLAAETFGIMKGTSEDLLALGAERLVALSTNTFHCLCAW